jgi:hypothetical protein
LAALRGTVGGLVGTGFVLPSQPGGFVAIDENGNFELTPIAASPFSIGTAFGQIAIRKDTP